MKVAGVLTICVILGWVVLAVTGESGFVLIWVYPAWAVIILVPIWIVAFGVWAFRTGVRSGRKAKPS